MVTCAFSAPPFIGLSSSIKTFDGEYFYRGSSKYMGRNGDIRLYKQQTNEETVKLNEPSMFPGKRYVSYKEWSSGLRKWDSGWPADEFFFPK